MKMEYSNLEIRKIRSTSEEGVVEAYLTAWDTVDSYNTTFQRGCFQRTFKERGHKIRLLWNHERLAGKIIECREDDYGPFVQAQFNLDTQIGREAFAHVRDGDVDAFSFGFNVPKGGDTWESGVRTFTEVKVLECGPVVFEANSAAKVTGTRAENFGDTVKANEINSRGWKLFYALEQTIDDIYWGSDYNPDSIISKVDAAISEFHGAYMAWLAEYYEYFGERADDKALKLLTRSGNEIQEALKGADNLETILKETSLTESDLERLKSGKLLTTESRSKLQELPENIRTAHHAERRNTVEALCSEIRESGFNDAEKQRFLSLLGVEQYSVVTVRDAIASLETLSESIKN